jgi:hypothetical protein
MASPHAHAEPVQAAASAAAGAVAVVVHGAADPGANVLLSEGAICKMCGSTSLETPWLEYANRDKSQPKGRWCAPCNAVLWSHGKFFGRQRAAEQWSQECFRQEWAERRATYVSGKKITRGASKSISTTEGIVADPDERDERLKLHEDTSAVISPLGYTDILTPEAYLLRYGRTPEQDGRSPMLTKLADSTVISAVKVFVGESGAWRVTPETRTTVRKDAIESSTCSINCQRLHVCT